MEKQARQRVLRRAMAGAVLVALVVVGLAASRPQTTAGGTSTVASSETEIVGIDWVGFLKLNGITYLETGTKPGRALAQSDVGPLFARVRFEVEGNIHDPGYQIQDGDAAFLEVGTPVYMVKGYAPTFRLMAFYDGWWTLFEVEQNPHAAHGADLLDIGGKVRSIGINSWEDGTTQLGEITDPKQVSRLVQMVLEAKVRQPMSVGGNETAYFVVFYLLDGTTETLAYFQQSSEMTGGIYVPPAFGQAIEQAIGK
jgi:hypothetical protein